MKRPYQFLHLALLFLLLTSATFSQSGAAKSLEIGNQCNYYPLQVGNNWIYGWHMELETDYYDTTYIEITDILIINNKKYYLFENNNEMWYERMDTATNTVYQLLLSDSTETKKYPPYSDCHGGGTTQLFNLEINVIRCRYGFILSDRYEFWGEDFGLFREIYEGAGGDTYIAQLIACRINGVDYGDITLLDVEDEIEATIPENFYLLQNYPNPFNPTTQISYELPQDSNVELTIYNILGKEIIKLVNENQAIGKYNINWNGQNSFGEQVPGGVYFYTLKTKDFTKTRKMLLLR